MFYQTKTILEYSGLTTEAGNWTYTVATLNTVPNSLTTQRLYNTILVWLIHCCKIEIPKVNLLWYLYGRSCNYHCIYFSNLWWRSNITRICYYMVTPALIMISFWCKLFISASLFFKSFDYKVFGIPKNYSIYFD